MQTLLRWGVHPSGRHHPAAKWFLAVLFGVIVLGGVPGGALASPPSVMPPNGPQSGGYFTGTYTFATYISCTSGVSYSDSYSNNLDGTHTFAFYGSADGSLLVRIDGGGYALINSCGDPFTGSRTNVATYTVSKGVPPTPTPAPTPAPTPVPTPYPTPVPVNNAAGNSGGTNGGLAVPSSSGSVRTPSPSAPKTNTQASSSNSVSSPATSSLPVAATQPQPGNSLAPQPIIAAPGLQSSPSSVSPSSRALGKTPPVLARASHRSFSVKDLIVWGIVVILLGALILGWRNTRLRHFIVDCFVGLKIALSPYVFKLKVWIHRHSRGHDQPRGHRFSHRSHSGKLLAHHHTNYGALTLVVLVGFLATVAASAVSFADSSSSSTISLTVQGSPPTTAPTITAPVDGDQTSSSTITVRGTCEAGLFIGLYRNSVGAGSLICPASAVYAILISVVDGNNLLEAYNVDAIGQRGPASNQVNINYLAPPPPTPTPTPVPAITPVPTPLPVTPTPMPTLNPTASPSAGPPAPASTPAASTPVPKTGSTKTPANPKTVRPTTAPRPILPPFFVSTDNLFLQGVQTGQPVSLPTKISGGKSPFLVNYDWGDGANDSTYLLVPNNTGQHTYSQPGTYRVLVSVTDVLRREAVVTLGIIVSGDPTTGAVVTDSGANQSSGRDLIQGYLLIAWPLIVLAGLTVLCFWLGERREDHITRQRLQARI